MPCYCKEKNQYNNDLRILLQIRGELIELCDLFHQEFTGNKTKLKDFFYRSNPACFKVDREEELEATIDEYQKTLSGYGGAFDNMLNDLEADIADASDKISEYTYLDKAYHDEQVMKG